MNIGTCMYVFMYVHVCMYVHIHNCVISRIFCLSRLGLNVSHKRLLAAY